MCPHYPSHANLNQRLARWRNGVGLAVQHHGCHRSQVQSKCKGREDSQDWSHRPHILKTTLTPAQELLVVELRRMVLLPLDDLLAITREFINAAVSRSGLDRCLRQRQSR